MRFRHRTVTRSAGPRGRARLPRLIGFAVPALAALLLAGCGDDDGRPVRRGTLRLIAAYTGELGSVDGQHPLVACLYRGANAHALGTPAATAAMTSSPDTVEIGLEAGSYTLWVYFDRDGGTGLLARPYELYEDRALGEDPDLIVIDADGWTTIAVAFDDARMQDPWTALPAFALPDSNPASATHGDLWTGAALADARALLYFAGPDSARAPSLLLQDVNPTSSTRGRYFSLDRLRGQRVIMYFGGAGCPICRQMFAAVTRIVADLQAEGLAVTGAMINNSLEAGYADLLAEAQSPLPALQDSLIRVGGSWKAALRHLYGCETGEPLLLFDADGHEVRRVNDTGGGANDFDPRDAGKQAILKDWLREAGTTSLCGEGGAQFAALSLLAGEAAAAGVQPLAILAVTRARGDCLRGALIASGSTLPVLADASPGLMTTAGVSFGDLLLIDGLRRVRLRVGVGPLAADDLDLTLAADRGQVIDWLRWIE